MGTLTDLVDMSSERSIPLPDADDRPVLIIVDLQNDFCEGGALPVTGGHAVAAGVAAFLADYKWRYSKVIATRDFHPVGLAGHFAPDGEAPDFIETWPPHCVQNTPGSAFHTKLRLGNVDVLVTKGQHSAAYSAFEGMLSDGRLLEEMLADHEVTEVHICGLATSHCVKATALDARRLGLDVTLLTDLCAGVTPELADAAVAEMRDAGVVISTTTAAVAASVA